MDSRRRIYEYATKQRNDNETFQEDPKFRRTSKEYKIEGIIKKLYS